MHVGAEDKQLEANNICLENSQHEASSLTTKDIPEAGWATVLTFGHFQCKMMVTISVIFWLYFCTLG